MPNVDARTPHGDFPLPHKDNVMSEDVGRIATALTGLDGAVHELAEAEAQEDDILEIPVGGQLSVGRGYYLPSGNTATMPATPAEDDWVDFVPVGSPDNFSADVSFAHPVAGRPTGTHQYDVYQRRRFTFHNGAWS